MRRLRDVVPAGLRLPVLVAPAAAAGVIIGGGGVVDVLVVLGLVAVVVGLVGGGQLLSRRRVRGRRAAMPYGTGAWRAWLEPIEATDLLGDGGFLAWTYDSVPVEVHGTGDGLTVTPGRGARVLGWYRATGLEWDEIADAAAGDPVHVVSGRPRLVALVPVTLLLVGERADPGGPAREDDPDDLDGLGDRDEVDPEMWRNPFGPEPVPGAWPVTLLVDDPDGLVELIHRYRRGRRPG